MKQPFLLKTILFALINISVLTMYAAIDYTEWAPENMPELLNKAKSDKQMVMVVVTQPDWCPPCIKLENKIIKNTDETEFSALSKDWLILEVFGYDEAGAKFLKDQDLKFHGTPTVFLLDTKQLAQNKKSHAIESLKLGDLKVIHSIAGMPDDFTTQFKKAASGYDLLAEAQKNVREDQSLEAFKNLATAYIDQGKAKQANRVYQSILMRDDLLDEEIQDIKWEQIFQVTQRVVKDHAGTVAAIDQFVEKHPEFIKDKDNFESYAYRRAWSLVAIDRVDEANAVLKKAYVDANEVEGLKTYLYFAFRNPAPKLLTDAEVICEKALKEFPDSEMSLIAAQGRLMRRLNRLNEAKVAFTRAMELAVDDEEALETYTGQLEFVEQELLKRKTKS